jgi:hypothetical protein
VVTALDGDICHFLAVDFREGERQWLVGSVNAAF